MCCCEANCLENELKLNSKKSKRLRFCFKQKYDLSFYKINNLNIEMVNNHKHLGVVYDCKLSLNFHVDMITEKANQKFNFLKISCRNVNGFI